MIDRFPPALSGRRRSAKSLPRRRLGALPRVAVRFVHGGHGCADGRAERRLGAAPDACRRVAPCGGRAPGGGRQALRSAGAGVLQEISGQSLSRQCLSRIDRVEPGSEAHSRTRARPSSARSRRSNSAPAMSRRRRGRRSARLSSRRWRSKRRRRAPRRSLKKPPRGPTRRARPRKAPGARPRKPSACAGSRPNTRRALPKRWKNPHAKAAAAGTEKP